MTLTRVALDLCEHCLNGCTRHPNASGHGCKTEGCALREAEARIPYEGLREHVKVMWPAPLLACVEALRRVRNLAADATTQPLWHVLREMEAIERIAAAALAAWDAESGGERPGNGVEGLTEPSPSALAHGVSGRSPALIGDVSDGCGVDGHAGYTAAQLSGTAAASAEGWSSAPSGQATAEQAPKLARAGIKPGHPSDTSPPDPAAVPPATSPASDVHAGGGAPAGQSGGWK